MFLAQKAEKLGVGPILLGFFLFVVVGSGASSLMLVVQPQQLQPMPVLRPVWFWHCRAHVSCACPAALLQIIRTATSKGGLF